MSLLEQELQYTSGVYPKREVTFVRGEGAYLYDESGRRYIDCVAGIGSANLGHAHPAIVAALSEQAARLITCPEIFTNDRRAQVLKRLVQAAPAGMERAFLCNSGTEAIEGALKFARLKSGRSEIVAAMRAFHGRTLGALSATWEKKYREPFEPLVPAFRHVPYNDLEKLTATVSDKTAAVLLEPLQGEGGVRPGSAEFLKGAQDLCRQHGAFLVLDEIQTGYGRTGKLFAAEHHGLQPDLLCIAKSMAGGMPMGAIIIGERIGELPPLVHGSTFGGNPLACAAALATLDVVERDQLPQRAARLGEHAMQRLRQIDSPLVRDVRGQGLLLGVELKTKAAPLVRRLQEQNVLLLLAGPTVLRMLPPLVIKESDLDQVLDTMEQVLTTPHDG